MAERISGDGGIRVQSDNVAKETTPRSRPIAATGSGVFVPVWRETAHRFAFRVTVAFDLQGDPELDPSQLGKEDPGKEDPRWGPGSRDRASPGGDRDIGGSLPLPSS